MSASSVKGFLLALFLVVCSAQAWPAESAAPKAAKVPSAELKALAAALNATQTQRLLTLVNQGDAGALSDLPGIGPARAAAIEKARPFAEPLDLLRVSGIGEATLTGILQHVRAGFPKTRPKGKKT